ncbi:MAG: response regulator, partial [Planctomycetota bacterium]
MSAAEGNSGRRRSVLVVTDTPEDLHVLQDQLGDAGYDLVQTWGTDQALEMVRAEPPDIVLLDVATPHQEAEEFCHQLRASPHTEAIPVVVIAEDSQEEPAEKVLEMGADGCICRPFRPAELISRVGTLVRMK